VLHPVERLTASLSDIVGGLQRNEPAEQIAKRHDITRHMVETIRAALVGMTMRRVSHRGKPTRAGSRVFGRKRVNSPNTAEVGRFWAHTVGGLEI